MADSRFSLSQQNTTSGNPQDTSIPAAARQYVEDYKNDQQLKQERQRQQRSKIPTDHRGDGDQAIEDTEENNETTATAGGSDDPDDPPYNWYADVKQRVKAICSVIEDMLVSMAVIIAACCSASTLTIAAYVIFPLASVAAWLKVLRNFRHAWRTYKQRSFDEALSFCQKLGIVGKGIVNFDTFMAVVITAATVLSFTAVAQLAPALFVLALAVRACWHVGGFFVNLGIACFHYWRASHPPARFDEYGDEYEYTAEELARHKQEYRQKAREDLKAAGWHALKAVVFAALGTAIFLVFNAVPGLNTIFTAPFLHFLHLSAVGTAIMSGLQTVFTALSSSPLWTGLTCAAGLVGLSIINTLPSLWLARFGSEGLGSYLYNKLSSCFGSCVSSMRRRESSASSASSGSSDENIASASGDKNALIDSTEQRQEGGIRKVVSSLFCGSLFCCWPRNDSPSSNTREATNQYQYVDNNFIPGFTPSASNTGQNNQAGAVSDDQGTAYRFSSVGGVKVMM